MFDHIRIRCTNPFRLGFLSDRNDPTFPDRDPPAVVLTIFLDAVDETTDLSVLDRALRELLGGALSPHTQVVMTCRQQALAAVG
jgi:hypothetical protein